MFGLKEYQKNTLDTLSSYLEQVRYMGAQGAYHKIKDGCAYNKINNLEQVPYVCLRLPTGDGKTYLETETPMVLWFCPTNTIKTQTIETLKNPRRPNREVLEKAFGGDVLVFDIEDYANVRAQELQSLKKRLLKRLQNKKENSTGATTSIDIKGNHIEDRYIQKTLALNLGNTQADWTIPKLAIWVTRQIPDNSIAQQRQVQFVRQLIENLCIKEVLR